MNVVMLAFPKMTQLDLTGPFEIFSRFSELTIDLAWKNKEPVEDASGLRILPTVTFSACPTADILFVPGGPGQLALMEDAETLSFLRQQAAGARYVTSVCTGSLVLAAAGLLTGYRATCHWLSLPQLALLGAQPVESRVVIDRDRITGAGVTSGIDFALVLGSLLFGDERARFAQLALEYDPQPPFTSGSPHSANSETIGSVVTASEDFQALRRAAASRAAAKLIS